MIPRSGVLNFVRSGLARLRNIFPCLLQAQCQLRILDGGPIDGFVGFFDTHFRGSPENPVDCEVIPEALNPCNLV